MKQLNVSKLLMIVAFLCFVMAAVGVPTGFNLIAAGLAVFVLALVIE